MVTLTKKQMTEFTAWLTKSGAVIMDPTSEWEIVRVSTCFGILVAYTNTKGKESWPSGLLSIYKSYSAGKPLALSPNRKSNVKLRHTIGDLAARDGLCCWFCELKFNNVDDTRITIEHLVAKSHGGPNHHSNLALACEQCNIEVGNLSVSEKVAIRDAKRGKK